MCWIIRFCFSISCLQSIICCSLSGLFENSKKFNFSSSTESLRFASCIFLSFKFINYTSFLL
nr:MAG TPA: hypothetical protein [Caudoviricetes sp.]